MNAFYQLLKKDWRLNRAPLIALALAAAGPYLIGWYAHLWNQHQNIATGHANWNDIEKPWDVLAGCAAVSIACASLVAAAFGGNAFATERRERWADFQAMMPASRPWIVFSKLMVSAGPLVMIIAANLVIWPAALYSHIVRGFPLSTEAGQIWNESAMVFRTVCIGVMVFGFSWFCSVFLNSATISAAIAVIVLFAITFAAALIRIDSYPRLEEIMNIGTLCVGLAMLVAGSLIYNRRVAP
jgi:ABC-type transport system involved in multi-copper enzyme maturation permease subunit